MKKLSPYLLNWRLCCKVILPPPNGECSLMWYNKYALMQNIFEPVA